MTFLKISLSAEWPWWTALLCLALGISLSLFLYRRNQTLDEINPIVRNILIALRAAFISLLAFLLMAPFFLVKDPKIERPIIIYGEDKSQSVQLLSDTLALTQYISQRDELIESLSDDFEVHSFQFGEEINTGLDRAYDQRTTDISEFMSDMEEKYENRNVAMMIMGSDGNFNRGQNPVYMSSKFPYQVNTIALGDTIPRKDALISRVRNNKITFLNNTFEVRVEIRASLLDGSKTELLIQKDGINVFTKDISIDEQEFSEEISLNLRAEKEGLQRYEVYLRELNGEISAVNNRMYFFIDVLDSQQKILILTMAPHPDISALLNSINSSQNYQAEVVKFNDFDGELDKYNMLIFYQPKFVSKKAYAVYESNLPIMTVLGTSTDVPGFNKSNQGLILSQFKRRYNEVTAFVNPSFQRFTISDPNFSEIESFPPLISPFATYKSDLPLNTWLYQRIGKVDTDYPLISFYERNGRKRALMAAEGIWKWRLSDYQSHGNSNLFDEVVQKLIQYMSLKEDKSRFRVEIEPSYYENTDIVVGAEYYDEAFDLRTGFPVEFIIEDSTGNSFDYELLEMGSKYQVNIGKLDPGEYNWEAKVNDQVSEFNRSGSFSVKPLQLEKNTIMANHNLLVNISHRHGGMMIYPEQMSEFGKEILESSKFKPIIHYSEKMKEIISIPWILILMVLLISSEWFLRKYHGLI